MTDHRTMWAIHIEGPDDLYAVPDKEIADAAAVVLNAQCEREGLSAGAVAVVEWPFSREAWEEQAPKFHLAVVQA